MGRSYRTKRNKEVRIRLDALKNADSFAKETFIALRKDDSCLNRFLRFLGLKERQKIE